ncbi:cobaltochelatase CobT-related protein [Hansschlegelia sp. KR7-227]|uniref:cobaltochelatase CobT-related protein n=1 Tax=Hansschlegelia sp. KR7-227 TaxID=3400914 RepID=UPI003BFCA5BA
MSAPADNPAVRGTITQDHTKGARLEGSALEDALGVCARAIAGRDDVALTFGAAEQEPDPVAGRATRRPPGMSAAAYAALRGETDLVGLFRAHHQPCPMACPPDLRLVVDALERVRVETLGARVFKGVAPNLAAALDERCLKPHYTHGPAAVLQAEALAILVREALAPTLAPDRSFVFVEARRAPLSAALAPFLGRLSERLTRQRDFADVALQLARRLPAEQASVQPGEAAGEVEARGDSDPGPVQGDQRSEGEASGLKSATEEASGDAPLVGTPEVSRMRGGEEGASSPQAADEDAPHSARRSVKEGAGGPPAYRVFTRAFDRTAAASVLLAEQPMLNADDDDREAVAQRRTEAARLAARLRTALMAQQPRGWVPDLTEGLLDPRRLARVVTDPGSGRVFRQPKDEPFTDTVVTLLIDNSSSMRGEPLKIVAQSTELIAQAVESCGVRVEALGFTTQSWRGGRARDAWIEAGHPVDPGRVSELLHIVYKSADAPVRELRRNLKLIAARGLHKENVDGEALEWACRRLMRRPERRRILIMISDGAPSEETTLSLSHYPGNVLEAHLRAVIAEIERRRSVELFAIGIGYDVERLYPHAVRIDDAGGLAAALAEALPRLLAPTGRRRPKISAAA